MAIVRGTGICVLLALGVGLLVGAGIPDAAGPSRSGAGAANASPETPGGVSGAGVDAGWLARAHRGLAEREYRATRTEQGLQAPNRAHNLRTYFEPGGIRVVDRTAAGSPELLLLHLGAIGREDRRAPVAPGQVVAEAARVRIERPGLVEWYANSRAGLEQGFTITTRPDGDGPLVLELAIGAGEASSEGESLLIRTATGRRLRYGELVAFDAEGRRLAAEMVLPAPDRVELVVDDAEAVYPVTIDPLLTTADAQIESDQAGAYLGSAVASAGDVNGDGYSEVIVGAYLYDDGQADEGAAFLFMGSATGLATTPAWSGYSNQAAAFYGRSVASAGDVNGDGYGDVIVGAEFYDHPENSEGRAYVYHGGPSGLSAGANWIEEPDRVDAGFGSSVSGAGDVNGDGYGDVIVGAFRWDNGLVTTNEGRAYVYHGSASGLSHTVAWTAESNQAGAQMGAAVSDAGDVNGDGYGDVIVAAPFYDTGGLGDEGRAYIYLGGSSGLATGAVWLDGGTGHLDGFGTSVDTAGDVDGDGYSDVIVGAPGAAEAYVYEGSATGPPTVPSWTSSSLLVGYGTSVAGAGDVDGDGYADVVVGCPTCEDGENDEGMAFLHRGSRTGVVAEADWSAQSNQVSARFGVAASGAGDVNGDGLADVIIGADWYDDGQADEGAAFVYLGDTDGVLSSAGGDGAKQLMSNQAGALLGYSVSSAGDVNGDGYSDVIVGAPYYDEGQADEGAAFIFHGSELGIVGATPGVAATELQSDQAGAYLGWSVASAGDVNGDGFSDVIVAAISYEDGEAGEGAAFVFHGSASGVPDGDPTTADTCFQTNQTSAQVIAVASAGDVNRDGHADVLIGSRSYDVTGSNEGAAFLLYGRPGGIPDADPETAGTRLFGDQDGVSLGASVASAGDVNGDGYGDIIVGATGYDNPVTNEGAALLFHGSIIGIRDKTMAAADTILEGNQGSSVFGGSVASAGDVNADGYSDVIVGASSYEWGGQSDEGAAFVFLGSDSGVASGSALDAHAQLESNQAGARFGSSVASAGDVNADGFADVIVGAYRYSDPEDREGAAFIFLGSATGIGDGDPTTAATWIESDQAGSQLGLSVASAGDIDGDGFADVIVSAHSFDTGTGNEGVAFVHTGNGSRSGRVVRAVQRRDDGSGLGLQPWGRSWSDDSFQVRMNATHPEGRGRVKLEVEACPAGVPFDDSDCTTHVSAAWTDVTVSTAGALLTEVVDGLDPVLHHWRARVLRAPFGVTQTGITAPPNPRHGPWRRLAAQAEEADVLVLPEPGAALGLGLGIAALVGLARHRDAVRRRAGRPA